MSSASMSQNQPTDQDRELLDQISTFNELTADLSSSSLFEDASLRTRLLGISRHITAGLQRPEDLIISQAMTLNLTMCVRACIDLGVFKVLSESFPRPLSAGDIARTVQAEELLMVRFLRGVCALHFAQQISADTYLANGVTHAVARPALEAGFGLIFDVATRPHSNLSSHLTFFRETGYKSPRDARDGPFQRANDCVGQTTFEHWMRSTPSESVRFNTFMSAVRGSRPVWTDWFGISELISSDDDDDDNSEILIVDVAGGHGHDLDAFARRHAAHLPGRMVLQDLPSVIDEIEPHSLHHRIEVQKHDFFTEQPVTNARFYFMHMIMHDWPDHDCVRILSHLKNAMRPAYSRILINDAILPDMHCPLIATAFDVTMMAHHCGLERSEQMWKELLARVDGLRIVKFWQAPEGEGIVEIVRI